MSLSLRLVMSSVIGVLPLGIGCTAPLLQGPHYSYETIIDTDAGVCSHMKGVFNKHFSRMWDQPFLNKSDPELQSLDSKWAFEALPGVHHDYEMTWEMALSKVPTSPEFDAIKWQEGRAIEGETRERAGPLNDKLLPILVGYFDIDNDGKPDTVIKMAFTRGYDYMIFGPGGTGLHDEYMIVLHDYQLPISSLPLSYHALDSENSQYLTEQINASYERPFIYEGRVYIARYDVATDANGNVLFRSRKDTTPREEKMAVLSYKLSGKIDVHRGPEWDVTTVCQFKMTQQRN